MIPAALALLLAAFPPQKWAAAIAAWGAVSAVAAALGPPLGGLLVEAGSWRWIFLINVPVGLLTVWLGLRRLRESRAVETAPPDVPGAVLLAGATGALALALVQGETWGWTSAATLGTFAAALAIGGLLVAPVAADRGARAGAGPPAHALGARVQRRHDGVRRRAVRRQPVPRSCSRRASGAGPPWRPGSPPCRARSPRRWRRRSAAAGRRAAGRGRSPSWAPRCSPPRWPGCWPWPARRRTSSASGCPTSSSPASASASACRP